METTNNLEIFNFFLSKETDFIHLSYDKRPFSKSDRIPLYHNFLYILALLKTKQRDNLEKGIEKLAHLLCFQSKGNFPTYLHQYPVCERRYEVIDIMLPLFWIYQDFHMIFSKDLKKQLIKSIIDALKHLQALIQEPTSSALLHLQIGAIFYHFGDLFENSEWIEVGNQYLQPLSANKISRYWGSTRHLSKLLLFLSLPFMSKKAPFFNEFKNYLTQSWHKNLQAYVGPAINEHFHEHSFEPTLCHSIFFEKINQDVHLFKADAIESCLISDELKHEIVNFENNDCPDDYRLDPFEVYMHKDENFSVSSFNLDKKNWEKRGGFYPLKIYMKNKQNLSLFLLQMGSFVQVSHLQTNIVELIFLPTPDEDLDIHFFGDLKSKPEITCLGQKATIFDLSDPIIFKYESFSIECTVKGLKENHGVWAHLLHHNPSSQMVKEFNHTYDWSLYFRKTKPLSVPSFSLQLKINEDQS